MFCPNCGSPVESDAKFCPSCGASRQAESNSVESRHNVPKCTYCGYVGPWIVGPVFRPIDIILTIVFLFIGIIPGLVYAGVIFFIRKDERNREKVCPKCHAKNLWTFIYK